MHIAAQQGSKAGVDVLVSHGASCNTVNDDGETPLHTAVQHIGSKDLDCISVLLEKRADPLMKDSEGLRLFRTC